MGFRISYLASAVSEAELVRRVGLAIEAESAEAPDHKWWVARLKKSGWSILWSEDEGFGRSIKSALFSSSAESADVILCEVNETAMWSSAECWSGQKTIWRITHAGDGKNRYDLSIEGTPPDGFGAIKDAHFRAQQEDDGSADHIFDIPLNVAAEQHGFRHDIYLGANEVAGFWLVTPPQKRGLLSRLFGR